MPINNTTSSTATSADTSLVTSKTPKKKTTRKSSASASGTGRSTRKSTAPKSMEILFDALPNPYQPAQPPFIWIDHPQDGEQLQGPVYVIRLGVGGAEQVQISIDKGPWQPCRLTSGYWWYDWSAIAPGKHTLVARMLATDGRWFRTPVQSIEYRA